MAANLLDNFKTNDRVQNNGNFCENQTMIGEVHTRDSPEDVTDDRIGESDSGNGMSDSSERLSNLIDEEREGTSEGRLVKIEIEESSEVGVNEEASATEEHARGSNRCSDIKTSVEGELQDQAYTNSEIKQEENNGCDNDYDEGIIEEFSENHEDLHNHGEPYSEETMSCCEPKVREALLIQIMEVCHVRSKNHEKGFPSFVSQTGS